MSQGQPRPLDPNALDHTLNMMPWRSDEIETAKLRQFAEQLWLQFCIVPAQTADQWREAVEERFAVNHTDMPEDPREAIKKLIATEVRDALDPSISSAAFALIQSGVPKGWELMPTNPTQGMIGAVPKERSAI